MKHAPHVVRMQHELVEVRGRLDRLLEFLDTRSHEIGPLEVGRMWRQAAYMDGYCRVLAERLIAAGVGPDERPE